MPIRLDARSRRFRRAFSSLPRRQARGRGRRRRGGARHHRRGARARRRGAGRIHPKIRPRRPRRRRPARHARPRSMPPTRPATGRRAMRSASRATASRPITAASCRPTSASPMRSGVELGWRWTAIAAVGLYVPGGTAAYPSSVLMNAVPAKVAGVPRIVMVVPAPDGRLNPLVLAAAKLAGVDEIYRVGGAQAVAALAYGTATIAPVDKIVGPGNAYVAAAKRQVFGKVGIDMIAGPSEILVVADARRQSGLDRRRPAGPGRARHRRPVDPDHRRRGVRRRGRARGRGPARDPAARATWRGRLARLRRGDPGRRARRRGAAGRPDRARASGDRRRRTPRRSARRPGPQRRRDLPRRRIRRRRSATTSPAPTTCCRPRARRASRPGSACSIS